MTNQDSYMKEVFPVPPLTAFKKQGNIKSHIIRAKVAPPKPLYPKRYMKGMKKCGSNCPFQFARSFLGRFFSNNNRTDKKE